MLIYKLDSPFIDPSYKLWITEKNTPVHKEMYQRLVRKLINLSHTRANIDYAMNIISQFMHNPNEVYLHATYILLYNLKGSPEKGIMLKNNDRLLSKSYMNADYARPIVDKRSIIRYYTFLGRKRVI